jgi:hypothetical protein
LRTASKCSSVACPAAVANAMLIMHISDRQGRRLPAARRKPS